MSDEMLTCDWCAGEFDTLQTFENDEICDSCYSENIVECYECNDDVKDSETHSHDGETYCESCYNDLPRCYDCGDIDDELQDVCGEQRCDHCTSNNFSWCNTCDDYVYDDDYAGDSQCNDHSRASEYVYNYSENVLHHLSKDKGNRLFGVELEVATEDDVSEAAEFVHSLVSVNAILKEDSSISTDSYEGFEIVTRPMTLANQLAFWDSFVDNRPSDLRSYDPGSCGLHIHVTRKSVSQLTIGKLLVFLNNPKHETLIRRIAQRYDTNWAKICAKKLTDGKKPSARYEMLNLLPNQTIEFRLFRGTLNKTRLLACIEFVACLIEFCELHSYQHINETAFRSFVAKQAKNKHLKQILNVNTEDND